MQALNIIMIHVNFLEGSLQHSLKNGVGYSWLDFQLDINFVPDTVYK